MHTLWHAVAHLFSWAWARNSAMSALQAGQGLGTLRTRIVRSLLPTSTSATPLNFASRHGLQKLWPAVREGTHTVVTRSRCVQPKL